MPRMSSAAASAKLDINASTSWTPNLSPERQRLAEAINIVAALEAGIAETSAAMSRADDDLRAARTALHEAEKALERAKPRPVSTFSRTRGDTTITHSPTFNVQGSDVTANLRAAQLAAGRGVPDWLRNMSGAVQ